MILEQYISLADCKSRYFLNLTRSLSHPAALLCDFSKCEFKSSELFTLIPRYLYSSVFLIAFDPWYTLKGYVCMLNSLAVPNNYASVFPFFMLMKSSFAFSQFEIRSISSVRYDWILFESSSAKYMTVSSAHFTI